MQMKSSSKEVKCFFVTSNKTSKFFNYGYIPQAGNAAYFKLPGCSANNHRTQMPLAANGIYQSPCSASPTPLLIGPVHIQMRHFH